ncbi:unnamed protein product [Phytophthora lilii]|uniref:RxLR effector protein n=1 Tax=Phytophthora lilii TaxID=2077276 RepID=A0A9W6TQP5_9STRA|nr:unnamed protein product [Phytophthora lilii]
MRLSYFFVAAAILVVSSKSVLAADATQLAKMGAPTSALSVNGVDEGARFLRSDAGISEAAKIFSKTEASYITKRLNEMLTNRSYAKNKFKQWYRHPSLPSGDIKAVIRAHGEHFEYHVNARKALEKKNAASV